MTIGLLIPYAVLLARTVPLVELTPFLGDVAVPRTVKLALALGLAALFAPLAGMVDADLGPGTIMALIATEAAVGLTLGFLGSLVFEAGRMAGALVDRAAGSTHGEGPYQKGYALLAIAVFLLVGGHRVWLDAVAGSYVLFPVGGATTGLGAGMHLARAVAGAIGLAVLLALPALATALLVELFFAIMRRSSRSLEPLLGAAGPRSLAVAAVAALGLGIFAHELADAALEAMSSLAQLAEAGDVR